MTTTNHLSVRAEHVRTNEMAHTAANRAGQSNQITEGDSTVLDPLKAWHALGNQAKNKQQRKAKIKQRGRIDAYLAVHVAMLIVLALLIVGGANHV